MFYFNTLNLNQISGGNQVKQGDFGSTFTYKLANEKNRELNAFDQKTAYVNLALDNNIVFTTTVIVDDSTVTFNIDKAIPTGLYFLEIKIDSYIFPSDRQTIILVTAGSVAYDLKELVPNYDTNMTITGILSDLSQKGIDISDLNQRIGNANAELIASRNGKSNLKTRIDDLENETTAQLVEKAEQSALLVEKARIDSFTALTSGSTTGDAELIDGRVAADGSIYTNIGGAIRSQVSDLKNDLSQVLSDVLVSNVNYLTRAIYTPDYYYITSTEQKYKANGDVGVYSGIAVKANKTYYYKDLYLYYSWIVYKDGTVVRLETTYTSGVKSGSFTTLAKDGYVYFTKSKSATQSIFTDSEEMYNNSVYDSYFVPTEKVVNEDRERIDAIQLGLNTKLDVEHGKNLFNPNENNRLDGFYVKYYNGQIAINADYSVVVIPVSDGDILSFNLKDLHVCALSRIPNLPKSESPVGSFISGFADSLPKQGYVVPTDAVCITVGYRKTTASMLQIERNTSSTVYERYTTGLKATNIIGLKSNDDLIKVGVGYDYETITEAVAAVPDGSTIMLMPGTYIEAVDIDSTNKFLKIIGFSRDACIWQYDVSDYKNPPLEIGKGIIENITFKCTGTGGEALMAYNVHIDNDTSKNSSLQFINCRFINPIRECVGIGLRQNFRLSFINCEFETDSKSCVYCHEEQNNNISGQYIELIDCSMKRNSDGSVILIQETPSLVNNHATIRMQRCIAKNTGMSAVIKATQYNQVPINLEGDGFLGTNLWTLDTVSSLNNDSLLNA